MNKFTQAALSAAASLALFGGALTLVTPDAKAYTSCSTNSLGYTNCSGDGGSFSSSTNSLGYTNYSGTDSNGNSYSGSCSTNSLGHTTCY